MNLVRGETLGEHMGIALVPRANAGAHMNGTGSVESPEPSPFVGIIGGIGPRASAAFVSGIYEHAESAVEQAMPRLILWSDPSFPDRTSQLLAGHREDLSARLEHAAASLMSMGASEVLVCCFTLHDVIAALPDALSDRIVSLVDLTFEALAVADEPHLLLSTTGSRDLRVFERHHAWDEMRSRLVWPTRAEQEQVHELIYRLKLGDDRAQIAAEVEELMSAHGVRRYVAGCTELHLLADAFPGAAGRGIDALQVARTRILAGQPLTLTAV